MADKSKRAEVIAHVTGLILSGALRPGDKLPRERDLAKQFGCCRTTVGSALRELGIRGVIYRRQRAGTFVADTALERRITDAMYQEMQQRAEAAEAKLASFAGLTVHRIPAQLGLDPITVYAEDHGDGKGTLVIRCYASAWTCGWGAMGSSLATFVSSVDPHYLADNMLWPNACAAKAHDRKHAEKVAEAVIAHFASLPNKEAPCAS